MQKNNTINSSVSNWENSPYKCYLLCPNCKEVVKTYQTISESRDLISCPQCNKQISAKKAISDGMFEVVDTPDERIVLYIPEIYLS